MKSHQSWAKILSDVSTVSNVLWLGKTRSWRINEGCGCQPTLFDPLLQPHVHTVSTGSSCTPRKSHALQREALTSVLTDYSWELTGSRGE